MLKYVLLAGAMTIAAPVFAQTASPTTANPAPAATTTPVAPATPATTTDAAPATPQSATAAPNTTAQAAAPAEQPATGSQVAQVVDTEFPTYDKDGDGKLSQIEFSAWMVALKTKSDPATKADSAETKKWNTAAFAQADSDKSKSVTKAELTGFLSKG